jgi:hypothetical protein
VTSEGAAACRPMFSQSGADRCGNSVAECVSPLHLVQHSKLGFKTVHHRLKRPRLLSACDWTVYLLNLSLNRGGDAVHVGMSSEVRLASGVAMSLSEAAVSRRWSDG